MSFPINFTGQHVEVTPALKALTKEKLKRLERHFDHIQLIDVVFSLSDNKLHHTAKATLVLTGKEIHASAESNDLYKSIDQLIDKLDSQVIEYKEKLTTHRE